MPVIWLSGSEKTCVAAFVFRVKDGKITEVVEYLDTALVETAAYGKRLVG